MCVACVYVVQQSQFPVRGQHAELSVYRARCHVLNTLSALVDVIWLARTLCLLALNLLCSLSSTSSVSIHSPFSHLPISPTLGSALSTLLVPLSPTALSPLSLITPLLPCLLSLFPPLLAGCTSPEKPSVTKPKMAHLIPKKVKAQDWQRKSG